MKDCHRSHQDNAKWKITMIRGNLTLLLVSNRAKTPVDLSKNKYSLKKQVNGVLQVIQRKCWGTGNYGKIASKEKEKKKE